MMAAHGFCECGCGEKTKIAPKTTRAMGHVKGQPYRFLLGHNWRAQQRGRAWAEDQDRGHSTPCRIWLRAKTVPGYASARVGGRQPQAHRLIYEWIHGPLPADLVVDHLCRQKDCVNPAHLEAVTNAENLRRGRNAKLTHAKAAEIRAAVGTHASLAARFGVSETTISGVRSGKSWTPDGPLKTKKER